MVSTSVRTAEYKSTFKKKILRQVEGGGHRALWGIDGGRGGGICCQENGGRPGSSDETIVNTNGTLVNVATAVAVGDVGRSCAAVADSLLLTLLPSLPSILLLLLPSTVMRML
jgi:hypothetical protein